MNVIQRGHKTSYYTVFTLRRIASWSGRSNLFSFVSNDLEHAQQLITNAGGTIRDIVSFGDISFFVFDDLDGNRITTVNK